MPLSLSEHAQIMKEVSGGTAESVKLQHVFVFHLNEKQSQRWEALIQRAVDGWLALGRHTVEILLPTMQLLGAAVSATLLLYGTSHLIQTLRSSRRKSRSDME